MGTTSSLHYPLSTLHSYRDLFADRCYLLAELHRGPDDRQKLARLREISRQRASRWWRPATYTTT